MLRRTSFSVAERCEFLEGDAERSSRFFLSFFLSFFCASFLIEVEDELEEDDLARFFLEVFAFLDLSFFFFFPSWELELEALRFLSPLAGAGLGLELAFWIAGLFLKSVVAAFPRSRWLSSSCCSARRAATAFCILSASLPFLRHSWR